jgi:hypothetical protein
MLLNLAAKANCQRTIFVTAEQPTLRDSFPLDGAGRLAGDVEADAVDASDLIDDAR